jgi:hypothetical protein
VRTYSSSKKRKQKRSARWGKRKRKNKKKREIQKQPPKSSTLLALFETTLRPLWNLKSALDHENIEKKEGKERERRAGEKVSKTFSSRKAHLNCKSATGIGIGSEKLW